MKNWTHRVNFFLLWILFLISCCVGGCVVSWSTGFITIAIDYTRKDIEGIVYYKGFPVWFIKAASGISFMSSWNINRFMTNCFIWFLFFILIWIIVKWYLYFKSEIFQQQPPTRKE